MNREGQKTPAAAGRATEAPGGGRALLQVPAESAGEGWSDWEERLPEGRLLSGDQAQAAKESRFRVRESCISREESLEGWERLDPQEQIEYGPWSDWKPAPIFSAPGRQVETTTLYRFRERESLSSEEASLEGWELKETETEYGEWSGWSEWIRPESRSVGISDMPEESETLQVNTKPVYAKVVTYYDWNGSNWIYGAGNTLGGTVDWVDEKTGRTERRSRNPLAYPLEE